MWLVFVASSMWFFNWLPCLMCCSDCMFSIDLLSLLCVWPCELTVDWCVLLVYTVFVLGCLFVCFVSMIACLCELCCAGCCFCFDCAVVFDCLRPHCGFCRTATVLSVSSPNITTVVAGAKQWKDSSSTGASRSRSCSCSYPSWRGHCPIRTTTKLTSYALSLWPVTSN